MSEPHVVILGSGPAGLGAAYRLRRDLGVRATVLEQAPSVGGCAGGFEFEGIHCDFGSHRLHPSTPPDVMADIRSLLGPDLLDRPRHGRIRLMGRWIHFPLKPLDLALRAHPRFGLGVVKDGLTKALGRRASASPETFASILESGLGSTICRQFYFPYAWKMWGQDPVTLSPIQARKRVSAGSLGRMVKRILGAVPGFKKPGSGRFFYPKQGFGQICRAYHEAATRLGAEFTMKARVTAIDRDARGVTGVRYESEGVERRIDTGHVWSTIPITRLASMLAPPPPGEIVRAASAITFRSMVLAYLVVPVSQFTEFDAHYFPETEIPFTRLSEPKNYSVSTEPPKTTILCAEIPCARTDAVWTMSDEDLGRLVSDGLAKAGLRLPAPPIRVASRRLENAYPIYGIGYEQAFDALDAWVAEIPGLLSFGRLGLFAHDNTHHALHMAYAATSCLARDGRFDTKAWAGHRDAFRAHVVED